MIQDNQSYDQNEKSKYYKFKQSIAQFVSQFVSGLWREWTIIKDNQKVCCPC